MAAENPIRTVQSKKLEKSRFSSTAGFVQDAIQILVHFKDVWNPFLRGSDCGIFSKDYGKAGSSRESNRRTHLGILFQVQ